MFLEILSPDKKIFEGEVESATFPGSQGSFQVLSHHTAMITTLKKGPIKLKLFVDKKPKELIFNINSGVVEIKNNKVDVLIEKLLENREN